MAVATAAESYPAPAVIQGDATYTDVPAVAVPGASAPVPVINGNELKSLCNNLTKLFDQYKSDRRIQELRWLRNLRQYLGFYDPEVERSLAANRSRAYPKLTRVKCISLKARIMDLMFPSDDTNWTIKASPSPDMSADDVKEAIAEAQQRDSQSGGPPTQPDQQYVMGAVQQLADDRAKQLSTAISGQLQELGGDQTYDYVALNSQIVESAIKFGIGVLVGPMVRSVTHSTWQLNPATHQPMPQQVTTHLPQFEFLRCWDFYPDMSAKRLEEGDGWFTRVVMSKSQLRKLRDRPDFMASQINAYFQSNPMGNYKAMEFETELRTMGTRENVNDQKADSNKYEVIVWHGPIDGNYLRAAGVTVDQSKINEEIDAEVWMVDGWVIKAVMNPWAALGVDIRTVHHFLFDADDTSPIGFGLPNVLRDTQMAVSAATRMMLDNASVVCGPILEVNLNMMQANQDLTSIQAYKIFYRDDDGPTAQFPAIREIKVESHIAELQSIIKLFLDFADMESFVSPATGGDMSKMPSEPMRNAAGASMLMGNAALPFKEIIRNFDRFTMSVIQSLVAFNRKFNESSAQTADYDVIARGASSLIAKELRGMQIDALATSLSPEDRYHVDERKMVQARFAVRDLDDMMVSESVAAQRKTAADQNSSMMAQLAQEQQKATTRNLLSQAFKNIAQGQKNQMGANAQAVDTALAILQQGLDNLDAHQPPAPPKQIEGSGEQPAGGGAVPTGQQLALPAAGAGSGMVPDGAGGNGDLPAGGLASDAGQGLGL